MAVIFYATVRIINLNINEIFATAGVITIGIGFAARTSISNFISGIILLATKIIQVEDLISVNNDLGIVENIDFFSTKLRTFDNSYITIPNEKLISEYVCNYSTYKIRRITVDVLIVYEDFSKEVIEELKKTLDSIPEVLKDPAPMIFVDSDKGTGINLGIRAWCEGASFITVKNQVTIQTVSFLNNKKIRFAGDRRQIITQEK